MLLTVDLQDSFCTVNRGVVILLAVIGPRGSDRSDHAVFHTTKTNDIILYVNGTSVEIVLVQRCGHCLNLCDIAAQEILDEVDLVDSQISQRAKAAFLTVKKPVSGSPIHTPVIRTAMSKTGFEGYGSTNGASFQKLLGTDVLNHHALILRYHQLLSMFFGCIYHRLALSKGGCHWLFAKHVLPCRKGGDRHTRVGIVCRTNADGRPYFTRTDAKNILGEGYQKLIDSGLSIMTENANQYVLKYADYIKDVPLYSSNYDIFDYDIPFAQMVLHGLVPFSSKAINKSADAKELRFLSLVTGTPVHYEMMYKNPNKFADSNYDDLYYSNYIGWTDIAAGEYKLFNDIVAQVSDSYITEYERINEYEYQSTFENGTTIYVNIDTQEIKVNGTSYELSDYGLGVIE